MRVALDTNILAYAEGVDDAVRQRLVLQLLRDLPHDSVVIPVQVLGELFSVLTRKARLQRTMARTALLSWSDDFLVLETTPEAVLAAADLATDHQLSTWDAIILAVVSQAGCRLLVSEDLQDGFTWGGVTVVSPFASPRHRLLASLVGQSDAHG